MSEKIVIYGAGALTKRYINVFNLNDVICFVDSNPKKWGTQIYGKSIESPYILKTLEFNFVVVVSYKYYEQIYETIVGSLRVPKERVRYFGNYFSCPNSQHYDEIFQTAGDCGYSRMIDYGLNLQKDFYFINSSNIKIIGVGGCGNQILPIYRNVYETIYEDWDERVLRHIQAVILGSVASTFTIDEVCSLLNWLKVRVQAIFLTIPYPDTKKNSVWSEIRYERYGTVTMTNYCFQKLVCIKTDAKDTIQIFVAAHKEFAPPEIDIYSPIWVGKTEENCWGYQEDKEGENIAALNPLINECTALYWIWKHSKADYIGLVHYRRYFLDEDGQCTTEHILTEGGLRHILGEYDIILHEVTRFPSSLKEQLKSTVAENAFEIGWELISKIIAKKQPGYSKLFEDVMNGRMMFPCNMFISRKRTMEAYFDWLFSIILEAAEKIDVSNYDGYSKRIIGFFAERLFTVWLMKQDLKIKELAVINVETLSLDQN